MAPTDPPTPTYSADDKHSTSSGVGEAEKNIAGKLVGWGFVLSLTVL